MIRRYLLAGLVLVCAIPVGDAHADDRAAAREHYIKGTRAFDLGAYDEAIREYSETYRLHDDPALLYNLAQAHGLAGHTQDAQRFYRVYLNKVPDASNRAEVEAKIRELQLALDQQLKVQTMPPSGAIPPRPARAPAEIPAVPPRESVPAPSAPNLAAVPSSLPTPAARVARPSLWSDRRPRALRIAGLATGAAGVALLVGGIACGVLAQRAGDDVSSAARAGGAFNAATFSSGRADQTLETALLAAGGVALGAGTLLFILGARHRRAPRMALAPLVAPGAVGLVAAWRF